MVSPALVDEFVYGIAMPDRAWVPMLFFVVVAVLVGALTRWGLIEQYEIDAATVRQLRASGEHVVARVASREVRLPTKNRGTRYILRVESVLENGARFAASVDVEQPEYEASVEGTVVPMVVDRSDTGNWRRESYMAITDARGHGPHETEGATWAGICGGALVGAIVAALTFRGMRRSGG